MDKSIQKEYTQNNRNQNRNYNENNNKEQRRSKAQEYIRILYSLKGFELFHDSNKAAWVTCPVKGHQETFKIKSKDFRVYVNGVIYKLTGKPITKNIMEQLLAILEAECIYTGKQHKVFIRVGIKDNDLYYDLGSQYVKITSAGWSLVDEITIKFARPRYFNDQVVPERGEDIFKLLTFVNITDSNEQLLFIAFIVTSFIQNIPHPILAVSGCMGSAKSSLLRFVQAIIDPSNVPDIEFRDTRNFVISASNRWLLPLDNLSGINGTQSNILCKAVTGGAFNDRELYTNDDEVIKEIRNVIVLNGINLPISKPDVIDRSIIVHLDRISEDKRVDELTLKTKLNAAIPSILGACFDLLSKVLAIKSNVKLKRLPRMADFALYGAAVAIALGKTSEDFIEAYNKNINVQNEEAISASPIATLLLDDILAIDGGYDGTASNLLKRLKQLAEQNDFDKRTLPKSPASLSKELTKIKPNLESYGYHLQKSRGRSRNITIYKVNSVTSVNNVDTDDANDVTNSNFDIEERAGIKEYMANLPREEAEKQARSEAINNDKLSL